MSPDLLYSCFADFKRLQLVCFHGCTLHCRTCKWQSKSDARVLGSVLTVDVSNLQSSKAFGLHFVICLQFLMLSI